MKNKVVIVASILLILAIGNYFRLISSKSIRMVEFLSIFVIGMLTGVLIAQIKKK